MTDLPSGWIKTTIGEVAELVNGRAFKPSEWTTSGLPIIRIQNLNNVESTYNHYSGDVSERHLVRTGDLLFAWSGTPGTSFGAHVWRGPTAILNQHIFNVGVDTDIIDREYFRLAINQTLDQQIAKAHGGAGLRHVTKGAFEATEISLPPIAEQRRIVERIRLLEERTSSARAHLQTTLTSLDTGRAALLQAAYDGAVVRQSDEVPNKRTQPAVALSEIATGIMYGSSAKSAPKGEVPVLRMGNIQNGALDWSNLVYTSNPEEIERYALKAGDVLFNRTNSPQLVGKTALYRGERPAIFAGYLIRIKCSDRMLPEYLTYCLNSPAGRSYSYAVKSDGVSQSNINSKKLAAFRLPCPEIAVQREIVARVDAGLERFASIRRQVNAALGLLAEFDRRIAARGTTGLLATSDPGDEPAIVPTKGAKRKLQRRKEKPANLTIGAKDMSQNVAEILREVKDWILAEDLARLYGLRFGSGIDDIEPFYAELRQLDIEGRLRTEAVRDEKGAKITDRLRLQKAP